MSTGQVSEARKQLANRGLILVQDGRPVIVTVVNIWELNTAFYQLEHRPDAEGWTVEQLKLWLPDVHTVNVSSHNESDIGTRSERNLTEDTKDVHTVNVNSHSEHSLTDKDNMSSNVHTVKQRRVSSNPESNPNKESKESSPKQKIFVTLAELCRINLKSASEKQKGQLGTTGKALIDLITDIDQFKAKFSKYWRQVDWRGKQGQAPTPPQIQEVYGDYCYWLENGEAIPVHAQKNGHKGQEPYLDKTAMEMAAAMKAKARPYTPKG